MTLQEMGILSERSCYPPCINYRKVSPGRIQDEFAGVTQGTLQVLNDSTLRSGLAYREMFLAQHSSIS